MNIERTGTSSSSRPRHHFIAILHTALGGLELLTNVTGRDLLARCAIPADSPYVAAISSEERSNGIYNSMLDGRAWMWIGHTSRDQYCGVFFGLATAYDLVPDVAIRRRCAVLTTRLLDALLAASWNVVMPDASLSTTFLIRPDEQLTLLQIGRHLNPARYANEYSRLASTAVFAMPVPLLIDSADDRSSYFKFNLAFINLFSLIRLEPDGSNKSTYESAFRTVRSATNNHLNPHFNIIDRALHGANATRDAETLADLDAWLKRPRMDLFVDWRGKVATCGDQACNPLPVSQRPPADFLWQSSPFLLFGGQKGDIESAGIDYLLPYWMGRYYGVVQEQRTRPAPPPLGIR